MAAMFNFKTLLLEDDNTPKAQRGQDGHRRKGDSEMEGNADKQSAHARFKFSIPYSTVL